MNLCYFLGKRPEAHPYTLASGPLIGALAPVVAMGFGFRHAPALWSQRHGGFRSAVLFGPPARCLHPAGAVDLHLHLDPVPRGTSR